MAQNWDGAECGNEKRSFAALGCRMAQYWAEGTSILLFCGFAALGCWVALFGDEGTSTLLFCGLGLGWRNWDPTTHYPKVQSQEIGLGLLGGVKGMA